MKTKIVSIIFLFVILLIACVEDFDMGFNQDNYSVVINGIITNDEGPYYVRLTKSSPDFTFDNPEYLFSDGAKPIKDAQIIISDNEGTIDTLALAPRTIIIYRYYIDSIGNLDSIANEEIYPHSSEFGYYQTTKIKGKVGNTYYLNVRYNGNVFKAECYMPQIPKIDSMQIEEIIVKEADGTKGWVPVIYFSEPQYEKNYYLFDIGESVNSWTFSVVDDRFLDPYVNGLNIDDGEHPDWWRVNYPYGLNHGWITVTMASLTEEGFNFYRGIINQFNNDGGVYSPTPTSPKTNISNGGLGFFRASAINKISKEFGISL